MPLITCPACSNGVSSAAASCPGCGHPLKTASQPTMVDSFLLGFLGGLLQFFGPIIAIIGFIADMRDGIVWILLFIGAIVLGSYMKFTSRHSVRTVR